jgi:hypothetical protein
MNMADKPNPARAAGKATPKRPPKPTAPSMRNRILKRSRDDLDEAVPTTLLGKVRQADKYGEGEFKQVTPGKRQMLLDERDKRLKRDNDLLDAYKQEAPKAKSFMSEQSNPLIKKAAGGTVSKKMAMGGMCRGMGAAKKGGSYGKDG